MKAKSVHSGYDACAIRASSSRSLSCEVYAGLAEEHNIPDFLHILSSRKLVDGWILLLSVMLTEKLPSTGVPLSSFAEICKETFSLFPYVGLSARICHWCGFRSGTKTKRSLSAFPCWSINIKWVIPALNKLSFILPKVLSALTGCKIASFPRVCAIKNNFWGHWVASVFWIS